MSRADDPIIHDSLVGSPKLEQLISDNPVIVQAVEAAEVGSGVTREALVDAVVQAAIQFCFWPANLEAFRDVCGHPSADGYMLRFTGLMSATRDLCVSNTAPMLQEAERSGAQGHSA